MPRQLTPQEGVVLQQDTNYLDAGIPIFGSRVLIWMQNNNMPVLIYHTKDYGYVLTDISDLGPSVIAELAKQSDVQGMWYYLPTSIQEVLAERAEQVAELGGTAAEILQAIATTVGQTLHDLIKPVIDALFIPLVITGVLLGIYLLRKG